MLTKRSCVSNFVMVKVFSGNSQPNPWYLPGKLLQTLQLIMQHPHSDIVVKVNPKNKGLTFKCR